MILNFFKRIITKIKNFFFKKEIKLRNKRYYDFSLLEKTIENNRSKLKKIRIFIFRRI